MAANELIAVIGSACRFPGNTNTTSELWELLNDPKDLQSEIPNDRFNIDAFHHPDGAHHGRTNARHGYFLNQDLRAFDAPFFNIQAGEAESMDPQQRLLLETTYDAVSAAGIGLQELKGSDTAVYVGIMTHDFELTKVQDPNHTPTYLATGAATSIASNRLSYFFDWHGPSMTIDTACSSSLVAVHLAVQQLRSGASKVAVAAGANLILSPINFITESKLKMLSPNGRSRMWDAAADGYARGEGVATVVLKTLSQALKDGDTIECIIRETGVNQDGKTTGITMPSHTAQEALIRETYARAGLDATKPHDRCQFFEAHGTGTPAGDPQEAEAISKAFFGNETRPDCDTLYVGSVKTVIGHTEGTAGIAGLLKASLAVQHGVIPPNMLFTNLSPKVAPFYQHLRIPNEAQSWPQIPAGQPRRASVNSFGFGGTNAHAIVEQYTDSSPQKKSPGSDAVAYTLPLALSAKSERSLKSTMERILQYIKNNPQVDMMDLAWTLMCKRSVLPFRHAVVGHSRQAISEALEYAIKESSSHTTDFSAPKFSRDQPRILGIFTGQGAQWPGMLRALLLAIPYVGEIVDELDDALQTLPEEYRPDWTLKEQLHLEGDASNVMNASFSQPLCCTVQIVLVRLLAAAGVRFTTVVGHSSGEIACAYAVGFISASQAIRVAYLRGVVSKHASSPSGEPGAMLAAGISPEDARELCELEAFEDRVCIAATNSPDSITLSGDADAIEEVQAVLEDESKFARVLKVDKAYHSHHMLPCSEPYIKALVDCGCAVADGVETSVAWYSSVYENKRLTLPDVTAKYWKDNLVSPVLFMQALEDAAIEQGPLDAAVEVGCHPALKAPSLTTLKTIVLEDLPYTGCMQRGGNDVEAFASSLGYLWERFGLGAIRPDSFLAAISPQHPPQSLAKSLPQYPWDHSRSYWTETRKITSQLNGPRPHLLLGSLSSTSTASNWQWQNVIRPRDHEWLQGHSLQGQAVFPAAGYVVMAMEAAIHVADKRSVQLLEILDMSIDKAITFDDENSPAELVLTARLTADAGDRITLCFTIDSCLARESKLSTSAKGQIVATLGDASVPAHVLPQAQEEHAHMTNVDTHIFYRELDELGYDYSKEFRCLYGMKRGDARATGTLAHPQLTDGSHRLVLHPASLDLAFQSIMGAYSAPGDKRLRSIYVPVHVDRIALVPGLCAAALESSVEHAVSFNTTNTYDKGDYLAGDVEVFDASNGRATLYQVENLHLKPLSPPSASEDHRAFTKTVWGPMTPDKLLDKEELWATEQDKEVIPVIERICYFYMKDFISQLTDEDRAKATKPHQRYIYWNEHVSAKVKEGTWHEWYDVAWEDDTHEKIEQLCKDHWYHPHVKMVKRVSEHSLSTIRENTNPFLWMNEDGLLTEFYTSYLTSGPGWLYGQDLLDQICHRYQTMDILEIGGGTGSATKYILEIPQLGFNSYTFTDISPAFFEKAKQQFTEHQDRMIFQKLDITRSPESQGFKPHSYDLVVASSVLHATPKLAETMANVRSLLKPGGHAVLFEATHKDQTRVGFLFGLFPDWWAGLDDGRTLDPFATINEWDAIFKRTGFSGVETRTLDRHGNLFPNTLFMTRAVNTQITRLYEPLAVPAKDGPPIVIVGGETAKSARLLESVRNALQHRQIETVKSLRALHRAAITAKSSFLMLSELDEETFANLDESKFDAVKSIFAHASHVLWLTENAWIEHPYQAMSIGMVRSVRLEHPAIQIQTLDVDNVAQFNTEILIEQLLRLEEATVTAEDVLWTLEPEVCVIKNRAYIPRIKHDIERNNRMNSERRPILKILDAQKTPVALKLAEKGPYMESAESFAPKLTTTSVDAATVTVAVRFALAKAIRVGDLGFLHLVQGTVEETGKSVLALADTNASIVRVSTNRVFAVNTATADSPMLLQVTASLIAQCIVSGAAPGSAALILEPPTFCVEALLGTAKSKNVRLYLATTNQRDASSSSIPWIQLHPQEMDFALKKKLPANISVFYDLSPAEKVATDVSRIRLDSHLPRSCLSFKLEHIVQDAAAPLLYNDEHAATQLSLIREVVLEAAPKWAPESLILTPASQIESSEGQVAISTIIHWKACENVPARVRAIGSGKLFARDKTYLLLGLASSLGRSLARWMVVCGAQHVVLSSRNPENPDPKWVAEIESLGGKITVLSIDVSQEASIDAGLAQIRRQLPPIAGIAYGPLVLEDALLRNMDLSMMEVPLRSKVIGANFFHERFSDQKTNPLDFFVMFSSVATVGGNPGQANYTAANAYLQALAQKRHVMGLPASTIHIGAVIGVGYLARTQREEEFKAVCDTLGETEFLALFGEAVVSGRRQSLGAGSVAATDLTDLEVITGVPEFSASHRETVKFYDDPRFGNLKIPDGRATANDSVGSKGSIKDQLLKATTMEEVRQIITDGLSDKMRGTLHIPADEKVNAYAPLIDQGVDSLGAITVGSWFSKQLFVDIPLLRVLSGASIAEIAEEAAERLSPSAIPLVADAEHGAIPDFDIGNAPIGLASPDESKYGTETPLSTPPETDEETADDTTEVLRRVPLSLTQEYSWKLQQELADDPTIFHNTIGVFMEGSVDLERMTEAFLDSMSRHEIFRTAFHLEGAKPVQAILKAPVSCVRCVQVADRKAAEEAYKELEKENYDISEGETLKLVDFYWSQKQHLLVIGYHRLAGDGSTTENFLAEVGQLYNGIKLPPAPQYATFSKQQYSLLASGQLEADIAYWTSTYSKLPAVLPLMPLPQAKKERNGAVAWEQHTGIVRLSAVLAFRIRERSKKLKGVTPMHFYLAAYYVLLARLTRERDVAIGIADTNRSSIQDINTMGFFANMLPVRMTSDETATFADSLLAIKEIMRQAMQHARVPYSVTLDRLGLTGSSARELAYAPLFQAVFDYRQGAAETGTIGEASFTEIWASRERTPYDVVLEMSDDPAKNPLVTVKLQSSLYGPKDPQAFLDAYVSILSSFSTNTALKIAEGSAEFV